MTTKFINKIYTFFQDEDEAAIVCNILEHINTTDSMMVEILTTNLVVNGYLQKTLDFFKWYYVNIWKYININKDYYNEYQVGKNYGVSHTVRKVLRLNSIDNSEKMLFKLATIGGSAYIEVCNTTAKLDVADGYYCSIKQGDVCILELPYNIQHLVVGGENTNSHPTVQITIANAEDISLKSITYKNSEVILNGLDKMAFISEFECKTMPSEMLAQLPQKCETFHYKNCMGEKIKSNMSVKSIHINNIWEYDILHYFDNVYELYTGEFLMVEDFLKMMQTIPTKLQKITYHSPIYKFGIEEFEKIKTSFSNLGYKLLYADETLSHVEFDLQENPPTMEL